MNFIPKTALLTSVVILTAAPLILAKNLAQPVKSQFFTERADYFMCRKKIIDKLQKRITNKAILQKLLNGCRDQFPGTAAFIDCKKEAAQKYKNDKTEMFGAMNVCKTEYKKYAFDPLSPVPIYLGEKETYFAGAGLNVVRHLEIASKEETLGTPAPPATPLPTDPDIPATLQKPNNFGNFSCDPLVETLQGSRPPEFLFVGNHPNAFLPIADLPLNKFRKLLKVAPSTKHSAAENDTPVRTKMFGEIDHAFNDSTISVFFPTGYCTFENRMGNLFDGIKLYYLIDETHKLAMPYFGIAFYKQDAHLQIGAIAKKLAAILGPGFKRSTNRQGVQYFTQVAIAQFDEEGDPANLCLDPRPHDYLALLKETQQPVKGPQYLIFANIRNLCTFGDMMAKKLMK